MTQYLNKTKRGFTVIELLIVVAILAVMAGLVLSNYRDAAAKSRDQQRKDDINAMHVKLEDYFSDNGNYPATISDSTFKNLDAEALKDPKGQIIDVKPAVADQAAADSSENPTVSSKSQYFYVPINCVDQACTDYVLKSLIEKPNATNPNPYRKDAQNAPTATPPAAEATPQEVTPTAPAPEAAPAQ